MMMRAKKILRFSPTVFWVAVLILVKIDATPCIHLVGTVANKNLYTATKELNWFDSLEYCHNLGMSLAILENEKEVMAVEDYLLRCNAKHHVWLAGTDLFKEATFTWMNSGKAVEANNVARWLDGQPDGGLRQNCVLINGLTLKWEDQEAIYFRSHRMRHPIYTSA